MIIEGRAFFLGSLEENVRDILFRLKHIKEDALGCQFCRFSGAWKAMIFSFDFVLVDAMLVLR